ncbi:MAG TPA: NAD-dependent epimerase/dehydratase family protein [Pirellulaceae bacterium]|nr:NAD-dependent epimerase/dehydratase family protein [Pirellulaceae bacterium]
MSCYLVTGCAGFIASQVCHQLLNAGHSVIGVDNLNDAYDARLKAWRLEQLNRRPEFSLRQADISNRDELLKSLGAPQPLAGVINLAARAGVRASMLNPWIYYQSNVIGSINLLELCREWQVRKFVLASSSSVYGDSSAIPYREDQSVARPVSPYAASKQAGETLAYSYHHLHGIDISILRFFTVYGPAGRPDMSIFRFVRCIAEGVPLTLWGDGTQRRDFTYVDDIARGTIASLKEVGYEIFNLGGDHPYQINEILTTLARLIGREPIIERRPAHPADVLQTWADISKAKSLIGWQPQVSLEQGLQACVDWYRAHREFAASLELGD